MQETLLGPTDSAGTARLEPQPRWLRWLDWCTTSQHHQSKRTERERQKFQESHSPSSYELLPFVLSTKRRIPASVSDGLPGAPVPLALFRLPFDAPDEVAAPPPLAAPPPATAAPCMAVAAAIWPARITGAKTSLCPSDKLPPRTAVIIRGRCQTSRLYIKGSDQHIKRHQHRRGGHEWR